MATSQVQQNVSPMCRVCMEIRMEMVPLFSKLEDAFIANIIQECTAIQILEDDGLPDNVCADCVDELRGFIRFIEKARQSDRQLRKMFRAEIKLDDTYGDEAMLSFGEITVKIEEDEYEGDEGGIKEEQDAFEFEGAVDDFDDANDSDYVEESRERKVVTKLQISPIGRGRSRSLREDDDEESDNFEELDEMERKTFKVVEVGSQHVCCTCFKLFDNKEDLQEHGKTEHEASKRINHSKKHVCQYCCRRYASIISLKAHMKKTNEIQQVYDCLKCDARFIAGYRRRNHAHNHPGSKPTPAERSTQAVPVEPSVRICCAQSCNQEFDTMEKLMAHSATAHRANKIQSSLAQYENRPVECPICYKRFTDENNLQIHQKRVYMPKRHVCSICGLKFQTPQACDRHEREHRNEKSYKCEQCPKAYLSYDRLKAHIKRHSAKREFMCTICGQSYMQRHNLQAHMLMHEGKLPFECEICHKAFRVKAKMVYHMRVHSGEKPYPCRFCDMAFADSTNRQRHEMSHTGNKPYKCDFCDKSFITKRLKREHEGTHSGEKPYQCTVCFVSFKKSAALKAHLAQHIAEGAAMDGVVTLAPV
ncbi:zinc finger protein ZFP2-like [Culex pipiens pallens]|uniref:zinc finger protein ZFP2-like n=1 Tax=Culex pipiens pallens TaxID=42434 RepID=UPI001953DA12|nr:zinc finger protein ZFP2-like [Culex pipiens pallens]